MCGRGGGGATSPPHSHSIKMIIFRSQNRNLKRQTLHQSRISFSDLFVQVINVYISIAKASLSATSNTLSISHVCLYQAPPSNCPQPEVRSRWFLRLRALKRERERAHIQLFFPSFTIGYLPSPSQRWANLPSKPPPNHIPSSLVLKN